MPLPGNAPLSGSTGLPSSSTNTLTAAELAVVVLPTVSVLLNSPVTNDGLMSRVVKLELGVLTVVLSTVISGPLASDPPVGPDPVLTVHCDFVIAAVKLPLLCADAVDHPNNAIVMIARIGTATDGIWYLDFILPFHSECRWRVVACSGRIFLRLRIFFDLQEIARAIGIVR